MGDATAIIFPGQGSQREGMADLVLRVVPELHELAVEEVGSDPFARASEGTRFAQPAILCASLAAWIAAGRPAADAFAGHSLGELGAAAAAGAMAPADAVRLGVQRGRLMSEAAAAQPGAMLVLLCSIELGAELAAASGTAVANDNAPTQVVLTGTTENIERANLEARERGVRTIPLPVGGAFHSPAMRPVLEPFGELLAEVEMHAPTAPLLSSTTVRPMDSPAAVREGLARAIVEPVRWRETMAELQRRGVGRFLETGPGKALSGMVRRSLEGVSATVIEAGAPVAGASNA